MITIGELMERANKTSRDHGFWDTDHGPATDMAKIALMHTELAEATEAVRDDNYHGAHGVAHELADTVIRIADYCAQRDLDLDWWIRQVLMKNQNRPVNHGRKVGI